MAPTLAFGAMHVMLVGLHDPWGGYIHHTRIKAKRAGRRVGNEATGPVDIKHGAWDAGPKKLSIDVW